jgi:hypothetical protein
MNKLCPKCSAEAEVLEVAEPDVGIMVPLYHCAVCKIRFFWEWISDKLCVLVEP